MTRRLLLPLLAAALPGASALRAELIYGLQAVTGTSAAGTTLVSFDSATPGTTVSSVAISGLTAGEGLRAIDYRPANGQLYAISNNNAAATIYSVNVNTGALTTVSTFSLVAGFTGTRVSMDFNPVSGGLRVIAVSSATGVTTSYRYSFATSTITQEAANPAYMAGDPNAANNPPFLADVAYTNNFNGATSTTLYAWDYNIDALVTVGSIGGTPNSPNTGLLSTIFTSPIFITSTAALGFDISPGGVAYLSHDNSAGTAFLLDTIDLSSGARTSLGTFGGNVIDIAVPISAVPEPATVAAGAFSVLAVGAFFARRRRQVAGAISQV